MSDSVAVNSTSRRSGELQVQQLQTFRDVYVQGGYSQAAAESGNSVAKVWQQIRSLEQQYAVKLFEKSGRAVYPTAAADRLFAVVEDLLAGLESTFDVVGDEGARTRPLRIVTGVRMMMEDLAAPLTEFRRQASCPLVIRNGGNQRAEELLLSGEADLSLALEPGVGKASSAIHYEPAWYVDFLAIAPRRHPFAQKATSSLRELVRHPLIVTAEGTHGRDALEQALLRDRLKATIATETDNSAFTISCVQAGMGVGIVAGRADGPLCTKLAVRSLRRQLGRRQIMFMWRKGRLLTEAEQQLINTVNRHRSPAT